MNLREQLEVLTIYITSRKSRYVLASPGVISTVHGCRYWHAPMRPRGETFTGPKTEWELSLDTTLYSYATLAGAQKALAKLRVKP